MAALSQSDDELRRGIRALVDQDPGAPFGHILMRWKAQFGVSVDEALLARMTTIYRDEEGRRLREALAKPVGFDEPGARHSLRRNAAWFGIRMVIGLAAMAIGSLVAFGESAPLILFLAIICTAGLSLLVILPVALVIGIVVMAIFNAIVRVVRHDGSPS